jgi:hypothetical protein
MDGRAVEAGMTRVIVLGGLGLFGRTAADQLRRFGIAPLITSRSERAELQVDANDPASIRKALRPGDIVIDAAGPFHTRSPALVEIAIEVGFDVIDLNDEPTYAERVLGLQWRIDDASIRVLTSASSVSAVSAAVVRRSGIVAPVRVSSFLAPATRYTANIGTARSLIRSVGQPISVFRDGRLQELPGWSEPRKFVMPPPIGPVCGRLFASADAVHLPRVWPTLRDVNMFVDTNTFGGNALLNLATVSTTIRQMMSWQVRFGTWLARKFGSSAGGIGYEVVDADGKIARWAITASQNSYLVAIAPAVLAAQAMFENRFVHQGLVAPDLHVEPARLWEFLQANGISISELD